MENYFRLRPLNFEMPIETGRWKKYFPFQYKQEAVSEMQKCKFENRPKILKVKDSMKCDRCVDLTILCQFIKIVDNTLNSPW